MNSHLTLCKTLNSDPAKKRMCRASWYIVAQSLARVDALLDDGKAVRLLKGKTYVGNGVDGYVP